MPALRLRRTVAPSVALLCAVAAAGARADVTAQAQPGYTTTSSTTRDERGIETGFDAQQWVQRYRLTVDQRLYPSLTFSGGGNLVWSTGTSEPTGAPSLDLESRRWNTYGRLAAGGPVLNGGIDYTRNWDEASARSGGVTTESPGAVREAFGASAVWRPMDLPALSLRLGRANAYDQTRQAVDQTTDEVLFTARHEPVKDLLLSYAFRYGAFSDHRTDLFRSELSNAADVSWTTQYLEGRGNLYLSYRVAARTSDTSAPDPDSEVDIQQFPIAGLSIVEQFTATPARVTLNPNSLLVNGDTTTSAGVNLGTLAGAALPPGPCDAAPGCVDLGAQFQDVITPVREIRVYVDPQRPLTGEIAAQFTWTAYRSDNNQDWTQVSLDGLVTWNPVLFRFEVPIEQTQARYLKVVTRPLLSTATTDPQYREIFVTELQFYDVIPAELARGRNSDVAGSLSATTRVLLVRDLGLAYDFTGFLSHAEGRAPTWSVVNGLALNRRLDSVFAVAARVDRSDADVGAGWQAQNRWSASLQVDPLPTLGALLSYSGQLAQLDEGNSISNSGTFSARAELYEGLALNGLASLSWARTELDVTSRSTLVGASTSIIPNRRVSLTASISYSDTSQSGGGQPDRRERRGFLEGSASVTPFPALALAATVTRQFGGDEEPATLASFSGAFSPFPGGDLQLRYAYQETLDVGEDRRTRGHGPSARWNIRPGWHVEVAYSAQDTTSPVVTQRLRTLDANLLITFR